ncbi:RNA exonuclease 5-like [Eucyclogobius newberryi]|uniref:RNA exonuclease 5-like n=1 Tax=Eucyclogobius newberryi TaxID=166745 RepID=UPI003B59949E
MDPTPTSSKKKRKADGAEGNVSKRRKCVWDGEGSSQTERSLPSPGISVNPEHLQKPISEEQLLELLYYSALGKTPAKLSKPSWCRLDRRGALKPVTVAVVDHVSQRDFYQHYLSLPNLRTKYSTRVTLSFSCTNLVSEIFSSQVSVVHVPQPQAQKEPTPHPIIAKFGNKKKGLTAYVLSAAEMRTNNFPRKGRPDCKNFVCTDSDFEVTDSSPLFGLDCEMCLTAEGTELTRVSLVDSSGTCILDELVKPPNKIWDYFTHVSGVTPQMLNPVSTTLKDVQDRLKSLLPRDAILVGHSLECDLWALKMVHPHVIDSSLLYRRHSGQRLKLKILAKIVLRKLIQRMDRIGHDPCEDATAALELVQYFIAKGPLKIVEELWGVTPTQQQETSPPPAETSSRFCDVLEACGRSAAFFGKRSDIGLHASKHQWFSSDGQVLQGFREQHKLPSFSVLQFSCGQTGGAHATARTQTYAPLGDLCVLFAGPLPPYFSEEDVRCLFCCCGPLRSVRIIRTALRVHAELHFELAESALLALSVLNGLTLLGETIKVQPPVSEFTLDVSLTLEALLCDSVTSRLLFVTAISPDLAPPLQASTHTRAQGAAQRAAQRASQGTPKGTAPGTPKRTPKGTAPGTPKRTPKGTAPGTPKRTPKGTAPGTPKRTPKGTAQGTPKRTPKGAALGVSGPVPVNGWRGLREDCLMNLFSRYGPVVRIITPALSGAATHAYVEFASADSRQAALCASLDLLQRHYLVYPALTPLHLLQHLSESVPRTTEDTAYLTAARRLKKLDRRLSKVLRHLPEGALSVVVLR